MWSPKNRTPRPENDRDQADVLIYFMAWIVSGVQLVANWRDRRSRGQLPPRPAQGGQALGRGQDRKPGDLQQITAASR
jgi:hypothetical protein